MLVGAHHAKQVVQLLVSGRSVRSQGEHHHITHDVLLGVGAVHFLADGELTVHGGIDGAVGERFGEVGNGANRYRVADHEHVELGLLGCCGGARRICRQACDMRRFVLQQIAALKRGSVGHKDQPADADDGEHGGRGRGQGMGTEPIGKQDLPATHVAHELPDGAMADGVFHELVGEP